MTDGVVLTRLKLVLRADASQRIGSGHIVRCLTLAKELRRRGAEVLFLCRELSGNRIDEISRADFRVLRVAGEHARADARACLAALADSPSDWILVDHYDLDRNWERMMRSRASRILAIDDLEREHDCDALLDQNWFGGRTMERYRASVPRNSARLLGPRYALLQPEYAELRLRARQQVSETRVLVFFGAGDATDETNKALEALAAPDFADWAVDVVIGSNHPNPERVRARVANRPRTTAHENISSLAPLLWRASLALGAGGTTTWERLCMGVPSLVTTIAGNQTRLTESLDRAGYVRWIGSSSETTITTYYEALRSRIELVDLEPLVDGYGTKRVAEFIWPSGREQLRLRRARPHDAEQFFVWRNDPDARAMSFDQSEILWSAHLEWFTRKLADYDTLMYVLEVDGLPVGQIRFDFEAKEAVLSYGLDCLVRGRGWSSSLITAGMNELARLRPVSVRAVVKWENGASRKIFARLGWSESSANGHVVFRSP